MPTNRWFPKPYLSTLELARTGITIRVQSVALFPDLVAEMSAQRSVKAFFKPLESGGVKRPFKEMNTSDDGSSVANSETPQKSGLPAIVQETDENRVPSESNSILLTPDAKKRMMENQLQARVKLQHKKTPALHFSIGHSWYQAIEEEFKKPYFTKLSDFLVSERSKHTIFPPEDMVWSWTHHCPIKEIKVVIIGQDPYHGPGQAHGLCFSVLKGITPPPSLVNIYKELVDDIPGFKAPAHGNLTGWAKQGVLLLNACLTVRSGAANSHKDQGWETLTDAVIKWISVNSKGVVYLLWGSYAQKKAAVVDKKKHHLLNAPHPSPLSAHRGFLGCKHFSQCNKLLINQGKTPIDWTSLSE